MTDRMDEIVERLNSLVRNSPNGVRLASKIAEKEYYGQLRIEEDFETVQRRVLKVLSETTKDNLELKKVEIEAVFLYVMNQMKERVRNSCEIYMDAVTREAREA